MIFEQLKIKISNRKILNHCEVFDFFQIFPGCHEHDSSLAEGATFTS